MFFIVEPGTKSYWIPATLYVRFTQFICFCRTRDQEELDTYDIVLYVVFFIVEQRTRRYWIPVTLYSMMCFYCRTREQEILDAYDIVLYAVFLL